MRYRVAAQRERNCSFGTTQLCIFSAACGSVLRTVRLKSVGGQKQSGSVSISRWSSSNLLSVFTFASTHTGWMDGCYSPPAASAFHQLFAPLSLIFFLPLLLSLFISFPILTPPHSNLSCTSLLPALSSAPPRSIFLHQPPSLTHSQLSSVKDTGFERKQS